MLADRSSKPVTGNSEARFLIYCFSSFYVLLSAIGLWLLRLPLTWSDQGLGDIVSYLPAVALALSVIWSAPVVLAGLRKYSVNSAATFPALRFLLSVLLLFLAWILARVLPDGWWQITTTLLIVVILLSGVFLGMREAPAVPYRLIAGSGLLALVVSAIFTTSILELEYVSPYAYELALVGKQHRDTLFHAAIANMLEFQGAASIGSDGLLPISYHVLSHRLIGSLSHWMGIDFLKGYANYFYIIAFPLFTMFLCEAALALRPDGWKPLTPVAALALILCCIPFLGLFQTTAYYASETYLLSLLFAFAVVPVMVGWLDETASNSARVLIGLALFIGVLFAGLAKISTGAVLFTGVAVLVASYYSFRLPGLIMAVAVGVVPFLAAYFGTAIEVTPGQSLLSPFHYLIRWPQHAISHAIVSFAALFYFLRHIPVARTDRLIALSLLTAVFAALTSSLIVKLEGPTAYYFGNPGMWFAILLFSMLSTPLNFVRKWGAKRQVIVGCGILFVIAFADSSRQGAAYATYQKLKEINLQASFLQPESQSRPFSQRFASSTVLGRMHQAVREKNPDAAPLIIFVEPDFEAFWSISKICWTQPFLIPAITGYPMLTGLQPKSSSCERWLGGYGQHNYDEAVSASRQMDREELCEQAGKRGFTRILRFQDTDGEVLECG